MKYCCSCVQSVIFSSQLDFNHISTFLFLPMHLGFTPCHTELGYLGVAKLSSIVLTAHSFMIPVIKTSLMHDCKCGIPWGSLVFLAVPGSTFFLHLQDSMILLYFLLPLSHVFHLDCSHSTSLQR